MSKHPPKPRFFYLAGNIIQLLGLCLVGEAPPCQLLDHKKITPAWYRALLVDENILPGRGEMESEIGRQIYIKWRDFPISIKSV